MKEILLDGNVLVSLVIETHVHHARARRWFRSFRSHFATCVITQGTFLRVHMTLAQDATAQAAWDILEAVTQHPRHVYWEEAFDYASVSFGKLQGPKQVTDAWLAEAARRRQGRLMTFDSALVLLHSDVAEMIP